ncbi:MAG TPA: histidine kinase [Naasia sp.]
MGAAEPRRPVRSGLRRFGRLVRRVDLTAAALALAILAAIALLSVEASIGVRLYDVPLLPAFALATVHAACLPLAILRPLVASTIAATSSFGLQVLGEDPQGGPWPWWPALMVTQALLVFLVGVQSSWRRAVGAWLLGLVPSIGAAVLLHPGEPDTVTTNLVVHLSITGATLLLGILLGQWQTIRRQLLRERQASAEEYSRRMLAEDRARIARELHDVVAHSMSLINIQASTARYRLAELDDRSAAEFDEIAASSRQALTEMRGLLGVLRPGESGGELAPQPQIGELRELVDQARRAGMDIELTGDEPADTGGTVGTAAYRIVQEALTNALRHAPGARVTVHSERLPMRLLLTVRNAPSTHGGGTEGTGLGVIGMSERAASVGGTLTAGPTPDGGFEVRAELPLTGEEEL